MAEALMGLDKGRQGCFLRLLAIDSNHMAGGGETLNTASLAQLTGFKV